MPELPDIVVYVNALEKRIKGQTLKRVLVTSPFLIRTVSPSITSAEGKRVTGLRRLGKRICVGLEDDLWLVFHLMIAGRLHWKDVVKSSPQKLVKPSKRDLAAFYFENGLLTLTEAGTQKRASLHVVRGEQGIGELDPGGAEIHDLGFEQFAQLLRQENHTLKRSLTDPRVFSGIGNAYSDEIVWEARLSPIAQTQKLSDAEVKRLYEATQATLDLWVERLLQETRNSFPEKVTAFRKGMAVHGRYKEPCPRCGTKVQRIRYATNETNYCPTCQTGGRLLADRALSRILKTDWPKTAEELG
jgi:formamidopyrimidine-DNA glycosylase